MNQLIGFDNEFNSLFDNLKKNTLSNSVLVSGNKGIGKSLFIIKVIKEYFKLKVDSKHLSHHFSILENKTHPNIIILNKEIDEKTKKIKNFITIDQIRKLNEFCRETSIINNLPKFILVDSADDLNINAANAILKLLEEPKKKYIFIFTIS